MCAVSKPGADIAPVAQYQGRASTARRRLQRKEKSKTLSINPEWL
jgi:hypothetical protein